MEDERGFIPPQGLEESWFGIEPSQGVKLKVPFITPSPPPPPPPPPEEEPLGEFLVYPFAAAAVLDGDPDYTYGSELAIDNNDFTELAYWELNKSVDILSVFANFVWAVKSDDSEDITTKWQVKSGLHGAGGTYYDVTDAIVSTGILFSDLGRSGVINKISNFPSSAPITIHLVGKKAAVGTGGDAKIKSNTYIRISYKTS